MNRLNIRMVQCGVALAAALMFLLGPVPHAFAEEVASDWRPTYDLALRWINFGILAFVIIKYARRPLMKFLYGQQEAIQEDLDEIRREKDDMITQGQAAMQALAESKERFEQIQTRIIEQGQRRKEEIIGQAEQQSLLLIESAGHKVDYQIHKAKEKMRLELLDMAVEKALEELPSEITPEDNQKLINKYLAAAASHA